MFAYFYALKSKDMYPKDTEQINFPSDSVLIASTLSPGENEKPYSEAITSIEDVYEANLKSFESIQLPNRK